MPNPDERQLIEKARHNPEAFAALYNRFVEPVYLYAMRRTGDRLLAEDVTSATFEKALRHLRKYGWEGNSYRAWLYRIAYQQIVQHHRRNYRFVPISPNQPSDSNVEGQVQNRMQYEALVNAYLRLRREDQEVISLRLVERLSNAEAAEFFNCSPQNVSVRLYRALQRIRQYLIESSDCGEEVNHAD